MTQEGRVELCLLIFKAFLKIKTISSDENTDEGSLVSSDRF